MTAFEPAPVMPATTETLLASSRGQHDAEFLLSLASHRPGDEISRRLPALSTTKYRPTPRAPSLQFVTITKNPEVERKLNSNRHVVRSAAMKHAIVNMQKEGKRLPKGTNTTRQNQVEPSTRAEVTGRDIAQAENGKSITESDVENLVLERSRTSVMNSLNPFGTVAAKTNPEELDLASFCMFQSACSPAARMVKHYTNLNWHIDMRKMKSPCSIFFHMVDIEEAELVLIPMALNMPIIYHAMLYMASVQYHGIDRSYWTKSRNPLIHEAVVIKSVQQAIANTSTPSEEVIFGTTMFGVSQVGQGRAHKSIRDSTTDLEIAYFRKSPTWPSSPTGNEHHKCTRHF